MTQADVWTVGRLLNWTTEYLRRHGSENPRLDAEVLLAFARGCQRIDLYTRFDDIPSEEEKARFREMIKRRAEGVPVAYLVGEREFFSLKFRVTPDVLIPRPETEFVMVTLLEWARRQGAERPWLICDVGTGSGILAICAAKHLPHARVIALDISPAALEVARENAERHGVVDRIEFCESDLLENVPSELQFDFILSNPPYVSEAEYEQLAPEVRQYEPYEALVAGPRGTEIIERLVPQAAERLVPGGGLIFEISPMIHDAARQIVAADSRFELGATVRDLARLPRVIQARRREDV
ncbi:peptide chain release factor N(5)-glutamine methyltransferase [Thermogutta sp.]|uniref:peptide chain release factor N(5)-glutamine methyltransferase n=1 Tax=Thermogutta sp. TaxID=1962930 RepID=UPI0032201006